MTYSEHLGSASKQRHFCSSSLKLLLLLSMEAEQYERHVIDEDDCSKTCHRYDRRHIAATGLRSCRHDARQRRGGVGDYGTGDERPAAGRVARVRRYGR